MVIGATYDNVLMVEGEMKEISEQEMVEAIRFAHDAIKTQCMAQKELAEELGIVKRTYTEEENDEAVLAQVEEALYEEFYKIASSGNNVKKERSQAFQDLTDELIAKLEEAAGEEEEVNLDLIKRYAAKTKKKACRNATLNEQKRIDGRNYDEIRPIWSEIDYLPAAHGSALFTRGETQSLTTATLGTKMDEQMIDGAVNSFFNKFILHYNFPSFSTGEIKPNRAPGRREIGHGNLAYRALKGYDSSSEDDNPYTIRLVSDILESNGSSSMATVCAGTLALMDAGIPIKAPVSGIAMGLISDPETGKYAILSDILGDEDHLGDMDFKVTGTREGITACQMDIKIDGLPYEILTQALEQARHGRFHILDKMAETITEPKTELKPHAPRFTTIKIPTDLIGAVIGPGGKIVQEIQKESGATISIEEKDNLGYVNIFATEQTSMDIAVKRVQGIVAMPEVGCSI